MATDTKKRILDTAEGLFAEHGFPATSMRDITNAAGVNLAAINYHFGSKESLLIAVLQRRTLPINIARLSRLDALEAAAAGTDNLLPHILHAVKSEATLGEVSDTLRQVYGVYRPRVVV